MLVVHSMDDSVNDLTKRIIGCAIEVHRALGPGLQERTYENAMAIELREHDLPFDRQVCVPVAYKGEWVGDYRLDLVVSDVVVVEIKSVERRFSRLWRHSTVSVCSVPLWQPPKILCVLCASVAKLSAPLWLGRLWQAHGKHRATFSARPGRDGAAWRS